MRRSVEDQLGEVMAEVAALNEKVDRLTVLLVTQQGQQDPQPTAGTQQASEPTATETPSPSQPVELPQDVQPPITQTSQPTPARPRSLGARLRAWLRGE